MDNTEIRTRLAAIADEAQKDGNHGLHTILYTVCGALQDPEGMLELSILTYGFAAKRLAILHLQNEQSAQ